MRKLYEATGGRSQRWESLDNLGAIKADAAGIAYAIERDWLIISGGLYSMTLTEDGRRRVKQPPRGEHYRIAAVPELESSRTPASRDRWAPARSPGCSQPRPYLASACGILAFWK
jgi:hypothetical protein